MIIENEMIHGSPPPERRQSPRRDSRSAVSQVFNLPAPRPASGLPDSEPAGPARRLPRRPSGRNSRLKTCATRTPAPPRAELLDPSAPPRPQARSASAAVAPLGEWDLGIRDFREAESRRASRLVEQPTIRKSRSAGPLTPRFPLLTPVQLDRYGPRRRARIEDETPIVPRAVAVAVLEDAGLWLDTAMPRSWIDELEERAEVIYQHNARFRQLLRRRSNAGRDWLYAFTRHWLYALLQSRRPELAARLPTAYAMGRDLPPRAPAFPPKIHPG